MDRPPDFSEYGDKSLDFFIEAKRKRMAKLQIELDRAIGEHFYAVKERLSRRTERGDYGTVAD